MNFLPYFLEKIKLSEKFPSRKQNYIDFAKINLIPSTRGRPLDTLNLGKKLKLKFYLYFSLVFVEGPSMN